MLYNVHDLLRIDPAGLHTDDPLPGWAQESTQLFPWVVVRREAPSHFGHLPVGIRGPLRAQRFPTQLATTAILEHRTPWSVTNLIHENLCASPLPSLAALPSLAQRLKSWQWGLGGSAAFHLVTGMPCVTTDSDLDLLLYPASTLSRRDARQLLRIIRMCFDRTDALIETDDGAYALAEYADTSATLLRRTPHGPVLLEHVRSLMQGE